MRNKKPIRPCQDPKELTKKKACVCFLTRSFTYQRQNCLYILSTFPPDPHPENLRIWIWKYLVCYVNQQRNLGIFGDLGILESHEQSMQSFWKSTGFKNAHKRKYYIFVSTWYRTCSLWSEWNLITVRWNPSLKGLFNPILPVHFRPSLNKNVSYHPWGSVLTTCRKEIFD